MSEPFKWNPYADQPHNVAPKRERLRHHIKFSGSYVRLIWSNLSKAIPVLARYRQIRRSLYRRPVHLEDPFGISVSPEKNNIDNIVASLEELNIGKILIRIPSWEKNRLSFYKEFNLSISPSISEITSLFCMIFFVPSFTEKT